MMRNRKTRSHDEPCLPADRYNPRQKGGISDWGNHVVGLLAMILLCGFLVIFSTTSPPSADQQGSTRSVSRRFPRYGTPEFNRQCNWTNYSVLPQNEKNCSFYLRPQPKENEGIADWTTRVVTGHMYAKMKGCQFYMDYGPEVEVQQVLSTQQGALDWTVPAGFDCTSSNHCTLALSKAMLNKNSIGKPHLAPNYRNAYKDHPTLNIYRQNFEFMHDALPGFDLETGMACAFEGIVGLSPKASQFEPELFTRILPTLRDERNLVMTFYYRTGNSDFMAAKEKDPNRTVVPEEILLKHAKRSIPCLLQVEQEQLSNSSYSRVVWLVVSDSPYIKQWIADTYRSENIFVNSPNDVNKPIMPREIITTRSQGTHTRAARNPSTADFAEGMIDWYLIGESDMVFSNGRGYTYGQTAALRTHRPMIDAGASKTGICEKVTSFIREEAPPVWDSASNTWVSPSIS